MRRKIWAANFFFYEICNILTDGFKVQVLLGSNPGYMRKIKKIAFSECLNLLVYFYISS